MRRVLPISLLLVVLCACQRKTEAPQPGEPPATASEAPAAVSKAAEKHPWASFQVGSWAKHKSTTAMEVAGKKNETVTEMKQTLTELTPEKAVLEVESSAMGVTSKTKMELPLTAPAGAAVTPVDAPTPKEGSEDVTVAGKALKCRWIEVESDQGGAKSVVRTYMSDEVPGHLVKSVTKMTGPTNMETTMELVGFEAK